MRYTLATAATAAVVGVLGGEVVAREASGAVWVGVGTAFAVQVALFWLLFVLLLPGQPLLAYVLGVTVRFVALGSLAFVVLPLTGLPLAPTLLSLVLVFFVSTLYEPLFLQTDLSKRR